MRKIKSIALLAGIFMSLFLAPFQAQAGEYVNITEYSEAFTPDGTDGKLEVTVSGEAGEDGYLYLSKSLKEMEPEAVTGENLAGTELEEYTEGSVSYYRIKVADTAAPAVVKAEFNCPGFYDFPKKADTNGAENDSVSYKFTNHLESKIEKYKVQISVPEENEIIKVSKPSAYADYILSEVNGMRTVGISKAAAPAAAVELAFTFGKPFVSTMAGKAAVWGICLGIGLFVLIDRYRKAKEDKS